MRNENLQQLEAEALLLRDAAAGNRAAYAKLYQHYLPKLYHYVYGMLRSKEDTEEVLQDIFLKLWENKQELARIKSLNSYLFTMARHRLLNVFDHSKVEQKAKLYFSNHTPASQNSADEVVIYKQYHDVVQRALNSLPPKRRQVFELSAMQEMSHDEIARLMHISKSMVKKQLTAANRQVKEYLHVHAGITATIIATVGVITS